MNRRLAARLVPGLLVAALAAGLVGCAEDEPPREVPEPAAPWNPCDGLSADQVSRVLGQQLRKDTGDPADEQAVTRCALVPVREGAATFEASYLLFDGGLDAAWATMGDLAGRVTRPRVPGAEAARLVVNVTPRAALVTGFVENGDLIQSVNAVDPRPYDAQALVSATRTAMAQLSRHASDAGVG